MRYINEDEFRRLQALDGLLNKLINITVYKDHVTVCGQVVSRPPHIAPSQWLAYWELTK